MSIIIKRNKLGHGEQEKQRYSFVATDFALTFIEMQAEQRSVNLSASTYYVPESTSNEYLNHGAAMSEVTYSPNSHFIALQEFDG